MEQATTRQDAQYTLVIHQAALPSWGSLPVDVQERFRDVLGECARLPQPSDHEKAAMIRGGHGMFRLRVGDYRLMADKHCAELRVLVVGERDGFYASQGVALARSRDQ